jgi:putative inorganic carbon (HCO3(-)) transporter
MTAQALMRKSAMSPMWLYTLGLLVLWVINPELRRIYDWRVGYSPISVIALLPLLGVVPHLWSLTTGGGWRRLPAPIAFAVWLYVGAFFYGFALAVANDNLLPGSYSFANFVVPIGVGLWIAADADAFSSAYLRLTRLLFALTTFISVYGIVQWALVPPWDAYWLHNVATDQGAITFGHAEPYQIRVFSVLNSPGPFGNFMAAMLLMSLPRLSLQRPLLLAQMAVWLIAFGLSLDRSGWLMFAIGLVVYLLVAPRRVVLLTAIGASGVLLAAVMAILPLFMGNDLVSTKIGDRVATLGDVGHDDSVADRAELYSYGAIGVGVAPMGRGLGVLGTSTKLNQEQVTTDFDSGVLGRLIELGIPGALMLAGSFASLALTFFGATRRPESGSEFDGRSIAASALALLAGLLFLETSGDVAGLLVLMLWLFAALAVRSSECSAGARLVLVKA